MSRKRKVGQQGIASQQEQKERADNLRTQGRKGCKAIRINMAFTPENHRFIEVVSRLTGQTMTEFANLIIERYRAQHPEILENAAYMMATIFFDHD